MEEVASRYAQAIVSIAKDEGKLEEYKSAILEVQTFFEGEKEVFKYLKSYFVKDDEKNKVIDEITKPFELVNFGNFLKLLISKHIIHMYKNIAKETCKNINFELNIYEGIIYSTEPLQNSKILEISRLISKKLGRQVELKNKIDSRLIGGVKVVVHDHIFDGSIKYKLETLKEQLKERRNS